MPELSSPVFIWHYIFDTTIVADLMVLKRIIDTEYADILTDSIISRGKLRAFVEDSSFIDIRFSLKISGDFRIIGREGTSMAPCTARIIL
jgi:hypothetical protein